MRKKLKGLSLPLLLLLLAGFLQLPVSSAGIGFSVKPNLPDNQRRSTTSYFDLLVEPGQHQEISVAVSNDGDQDIAVTVEAITASTNSNGIVDYSLGENYDETMQYSFSGLATVGERSATVPPGETRDVAVSIQCPDGPFEGILLGSVQVTKELTDEERENGGMIVNQYSYVIAVRLQQSEAEVAPAFALGEVSAELKNARAAFVADIRNIQPRLVKGANVTAQVLPSGSDTPVMEMSKEGVDLAPNSIYPLTMTDSAGYGVQAGNYTAKIQLAYEGRTWDFEQDFTIRAEQAANINQNAVNQNNPAQTAAYSQMGLPVWAIILLAAGAVLLLVVAALLIVMMRRVKAVQSASPPAVAAGEKEPVPAPPPDNGQEDTEPGK